MPLITQTNIIYNCSCLESMKHVLIPHKLSLNDSLLFFLTIGTIIR